MNNHLDESLIEAYLAGGLTADERTEFAAHVASCDPCAALLAQYQSADDRLMALFADVRAGTGFEDQISKNIQEKLMRASKQSKTFKRWGVGAAAMLLLGTTGALANHLVSKDLLPGDVAAGPRNDAMATNLIHSPASPTVQRGSATPVTFDADGRLADKLDAIITPGELTADNQSLERVLKYIQEQNNINMIVNWTALKEAGVQKDTPVTINLRDVSLRTALSTTLSTAGASLPLDFTTVDGVARISTKADLEKSGGYVHASYDVRDLVVPAPTMANGQNGIDGARKDQVARLINEAKDAYDLQRYDQAQAVLQQAKNIDPNNNLVAFNMLQVDDKLKWQDWQKVHVRRSAESMNLQTNNYEAVIPYNDLMIYPDNWPEISRRRLQVAAEKRVQTNVGTNFASFVPAANDKVAKELPTITSIPGSLGGLPSSNVNSFFYARSADPQAAADLQKGLAFNDEVHSLATNQKDGKAMQLAMQDQKTAESRASANGVTFIYPLKNGIAASLDDVLQKALPQMAQQSKELAEVNIPDEQLVTRQDQTRSAIDHLKGQIADASERKRIDGLEPNSAGEMHQKLPVLGNLPAIADPFQNSSADQPVASTDVINGPSQAEKIQSERDAALAQHDLMAQGPGAGGQQPGSGAPATQPGGTGGGSSSSALTDLKIIRRGSIMLEVKSFLDASAAVSKAVAAQDGYIASSTSNQLPNGKVQGTITLRVKPDRIDAVIAALRTIGDVKNQQVVAEDVGKEYTDTESEPRALSAMETRLLDLIKNGKGEVKDLVIAEQQLGEYRVRIEKLKGQLNFFNNQIGMATLTVDLTEKDIKAAASVTETENINARIESEEVETGYTKIRKAIEDAKGRIVSGQLTTQAQDQVVAQIIADVPPDQVDSLTAVIRSAGTVTQFEKTRAQTAPGGEDQTAGTTVERKDTRLVIVMSNLAAIPAKETYVLTLAVPDVQAAFKSIQSEVKGVEQTPAPGKGAALNRITQADLQGQRPEQMVADLRAEVRATDAPAMLDKIGRMGEIMISSTGMGPANATAAKSGFQIRLVAIQSVAARQSTGINGIVDKVPDAAAKVQSAVQALTNPATRLIQAQVNQQDSRNISASLEFDISKNDVMTVEKSLADAGIDIVARNNSKSSDLNNTLDSKVHYSLAINSADMLPPRRSTAVLMETTDVAVELAKVRSVAADVHALETGLSTTTDGGKSAAHVQFDVPADKADAILHAIAVIHGQKKSDDQSENRQIDTRYTRERIDLTLVTPAALVPAENSLGTSLSKGFFGGLTNLLRAMQWVIMGLVVALPFLLVLWIGTKLFKRKAKA